MNSIKKIVITTGDVDGIGLEVTAKSLSRLRSTKNTQLIYFRSSQAASKDLKRIHRSHDVKSVNTLDQALTSTFVNRQLIEIVSDESPAKWVEQTAIASKKRQIHALVTAPLSKQEIFKAGMKDIGHTDILKRICASDHAFMGFIGRYFNLVLASGHLSISNIEASLKNHVLLAAIEAGEQLSGILKMKKKPMAVLGLNPHAGDGGIIGSFDKDVLEPLIQKERIRGVKIEGPLVPDAAFGKQNWKKYSAYVALYHDQGLIPFKSFHGFESGVHLTLGLPILRTSVDHGTAKDIFGKDKANPKSMLLAIKWGIHLAQRRDI